MPEIQALTEQVEALSHSVDLWNLVMLWALAFAALAAIVVGLATRIVITRGGQLSTAQQLLSKAKERVFLSDLKTKDVEIGELKLRSDTAESNISATQRAAAGENERAAGLEAQAETLRGQLASQQRRGNVMVQHQLQLEVSLKRFKGQLFDVSACRNHESEVIAFSMSVWSVLEDARWKIVNLDMNSPSCSAGITIAVNPDASEATKEAAKALLDSLIEIGLIPKAFPLLNLSNPPGVPPPTGTWWLQSSSRESVVVAIGTHP